MADVFVILRNGVLETYNKYEDIPMSFDNLIEFAPEYIDGPHTPEQHAEMEGLNQKLLDLLKRETK